MTLESQILELDHLEDLTLLTDQYAQLRVSLETSFFLDIIQRNFY